MKFNWLPSTDIPDTEDNDYISKWKIVTRRRLKNCLQTIFSCKSKKSLVCLALTRIDEYDNGVKSLYTAFNYTNRCQLLPLKPNIKNQVIKLHLSGGITISNSKIYSVLGNYKRNIKVYGLTNILKGYINQNTLFKTIGFTEAYICTYTVNPDDIKILVTSKHLMSLTKHPKMLHIDATYRLIDLGYPVIVVGITDANGMFILIGIAIVSNESADTYFWVMDSLRQEIENKGGFLNPYHIIGDSAPSITNAIQKFNPNCI
ncbi:hypothetical protein BB559_007322 [Furculomyces boomerangus]|uniref:MULE transposase domain-containing protein n=1 Tax=Furculomyces boomerangus TaxID=61424 RepID=A0A2T9XXQ2_9FUNG|nr:hypothetical protein BB559_007322 [Furculomyces boomerangus]